MSVEPKWGGEKIHDAAVWVLFATLAVDILQSVTKLAPIPLICLKISLITSVVVMWGNIILNWRYLWHSLTGR
jgi:hypothetical protein